MRKGKTPTEIRSLARSHTVTAINVLAGIMEQATAPPAARVAAARELLDRGWGKAEQMVEVIRTIQANQLSDDELADIAAGSGEDDTESPADPAQLN